MAQEPTLKTKSLLFYSHGELLGDGLLKLPALSVLRETFPEYHICWWPGRGPSVYASVLQPLVKDYLDEVKKDIKLGESYFELLKPPADKKYYDLIIDTQTVPKSTLSLRRLAHGKLISATANFIFSDIKPASSAAMRKGSLQRRLLNLIGLAAGNKPKPTFKLSLPEEYRQHAAMLLPTTETLIGFAPGAGGERKKWPLEKFIESAKTQVEQKRTPVFLLGPQESSLYNQLKAAVPTALFPEQENSNKQIYGPLLSIALAEKLDVGIANDSGAGHILSISGCPMISLFGHTNVEKFVEPRPNRTVISASAYGSDKVADIPVEAVSSAIKDLLT